MDRLDLSTEAGAWSKAPNIIDKVLSPLKPATRGGKIARGLSRGLRNNNPGNIRHAPFTFVGQSKIQTDPAFIRFDTMAYGCRALAVVLLTYYHKYQLVTIAEIISRWAPPNENNTNAYIAAVSKSMETKSNVRLVLNDNLLTGLCDAIIMHENGIFPLTNEILSAVTDGVKMAMNPITHKAS